MVKLEYIFQFIYNIWIKWEYVRNNLILFCPNVSGEGGLGCKFQKLPRVISKTVECRMLAIFSKNTKNQGGNLLINTIHTLQTHRVLSV